MSDESAKSKPLLKKLVETPITSLLPGEAIKNPAIAPNIGQSTSLGTRFRVLRPHKEGGLGVVSIALDTELTREVALKEIKQDIASQRDSVTRFVIEAMATGSLEHPGIVPVYGFGRHDDGRPFYAMRFIRGKSLKSVIKNFHKADNTMSATERNLAFRELLDRFTDVCQAIEYAHSRGVLHRDIKPDNIMVGKYGETLVVDWGLAKSTGDAHSDGVTPLTPLATSLSSGSAGTIEGAAHGTPHYMSPEQAEGQIKILSPRSDVYGLGATLATLLTGRPPVEGETTPEVLDNVRHGNILPIRRAPAGVPRPLWAVCAKAMSKNPQKRYPSAEALSQEIVKYLADEPVSVMREPFVVRTRRWMRKHPTAATACTTTCLLLLVFFAIGFAVVTSFNQKLAAANQAEKEAHSLADENFDDAKDAVHKYLVAVTSNEKLKAADFSELRKELLETAKPFFEKLRGQKPGNEKVEASRADAFHRLAKIQYETGFFEKAAQEYRSCISVYGRLVDHYPNVATYRWHLAQNHNNLGLTLKTLGDHETARSQYKQALTIFKRLHNEFPAVFDFSHDLAKTYNNLANSFKEIGESQRARTQYDQALDIRKQIDRKLPSLRDNRSSMVKIHINLANQLAKLNEQPAAKHHYQLALKIGKKLAQDFPTVPEYRNDLAVAHNGISMLLHQKGIGDIPIKHASEAIQIAQTLIKEFPSNPEYRRVLGRGHHNVAVFCDHHGQTTIARKQYQEALKIRRQLAEDYPHLPTFQSDLARTWNGLAILLDNDDEKSKAKKHYEQALMIKKKLVRDFPSVLDYRISLGRTHYNLGLLLVNHGEKAKAKEHYEQVLIIRKKLVHDSPTNRSYRSDLVRTHINFGSLLDTLGKKESAKKQYRSAILIAERLAREFPAIADYSVELGASYCNFAQLVRSERPEVSLEWYSNAHKFLQTVLDQDPQHAIAKRFLSNTLSGRASALNTLARHSEAAKDWQRASELATGGRKTRFNRNAVKSTLMAAHRIQEARVPDQSEEGANPATNPHPHKNAVPELVSHARQQFAAQNFEGALETTEKAVKLAPNDREIRLLHVVGWHAHATSLVKFGEHDKGYASLIELGDYVRQYRKEFPENDSSLTFKNQFLEELYVAICLYNQARGYSLKGEKERALIALKDSIVAGFVDFSRIRKNSDFDSIRDSEEFKQLIDEQERLSSPTPEKLERLRAILEH